jgi:teichoic acid transport system ATP-binding protein
VGEHGAVTENEVEPSTNDVATPRRPTVVVDDLHVIYRVIGGKRATPKRRRAARGQGAGGRVTKVHALKGLSFSAYEGDSIGIVGSNGSGKSTLLRVIAGLLKPTSGQVYADGDPTLLGVNAALMSDLSGERNIVLGGLAMGLTRKQISERFDSIVEFSGLGNFIHLPMGTYSSGMGARLRFAVASAVAPRVLLIDEALATGDAEFRKRSESRIREIRQNAASVFLVSHSLTAIRKTCNRALWIDKGVLKADGEVRDVLKEYRHSVKG